MEDMKSPLYQSWERKKMEEARRMQNMQNMQNMQADWNIPPSAMNTRIEEKEVKCDRCNHILRVRYIVPPSDQWENNQLSTDNHRLRGIVIELEKKIKTLKKQLDGNTRSIPVMIASVTKDSKKLIIKKRNK